MSHPTRIYLYVVINFCIFVKRKVKIETQIREIGTDLALVMYKTSCGRNRVAELELTGDTDVVLASLQ